jgi:N-acyl amino acid synthase of PEP-CTERM/exosortase system
MFLPRLLDSGASFSQYFQVVPAWSEDLKEEAYRIRHQVYCEDLGWEPVRADRRELDEYDVHSLQLLIRAVATGSFIGCVRLIRTDPDTPDQPLPFEKACVTALDRKLCDPSHLPRDQIAEVSRLAIVAPYRRRKGEANLAMSQMQEDFGTPEQPRFPYAPVALYLAALELARLQGITTAFTFTERRLAAHFGRLGVKITAIGSPVEHRGARIPSMMDVNGIIGHLPRAFRPLYRVIAEEVGRCPVSLSEQSLGAFAAPGPTVPT